MSSNVGTAQSLSVLEQDAGLRLDTFLAKHFPQHSRSTFKKYIECGYVVVDGHVCIKARTVTQTHSNITITFPRPIQNFAVAEPIPLDFVFEDNDLLVINKPRGLTVHPGAGQPNSTLLNGLLHHLPELDALPRAGIVHRLDKDTTGLMVVAKTNTTYLQLTAALAQRTVKRHYLAIVDGILKQSQCINKPIARHRVHRQRMAVVATGKEAITHVQPLERLGPYTLVECRLETGRTHQIRVHLQAIGHPLLGDATYGKHRGYQLLSPSVATKILTFQRQALHAHRLSFTHPEDSTRTLCFNQPPPSDMQELIDALSSSS